MTRLRYALLLFAAPLAGCADPAPQGPLGVAIIDAPARIAAIGRSEPTPGEALFLAATAQGLVALDPAGQIEPGLASRWIVSDDGLSYIFRLRRAEWRPGEPVTASQIARLLKTMTAPRGRNRLARLFSAVEEIEAVTDEIIEIRLRSPRPQFLALLAAPELALVSRARGSGPFRPEPGARGLLLSPVADPAAPGEARAGYAIALKTERAAHALVHYQRRELEAVLGGTLADLPVARALGAPAAELRFDPAAGLFGFAVTARDGLLASAENRDAVAMAIDRDALLALFAVPGWRPVLSIVPARLEMPAPPALPEWAEQPIDARITIARARIAAWRGNNATSPRLRVALPEGPGMRLLFARVELDLSRIGIVAERVAAGTPADLTLIDAVAPNDSATWYLTRLSCDAGLPCGETGEEALSASRSAPTLAERAALLKAADSAFIVNMPYIPIATPVRWSMVRPRLDGFRTNARAAHPLHQLLRE